MSFPRVANIVLFCFIYLSVDIKGTLSCALSCVCCCLGGIYSVSAPFFFLNEFLNKICSLFADKRSNIICCSCIRKKNSKKKKIETHKMGLSALGQRVIRYWNYMEEMTYRRCADGFVNSWAMKAKSALRDIFFMFLLLLLFDTKGKGCKPFGLAEVQLWVAEIFFLRRG